MNRTVLVLVATLLVLSLPALGCSQSPAGKAPADGARPTEAGAAAKPKDRPYYRGTVAVQQDVRDLLARVPSASPEEWQLTARKLAGYGEPAVPYLVDALASGEESVQLISAYVLGVLKDPRSLDALHRSTFDEKEKVRFEAATSMLRMGDRRGLRTMIDGLENPDVLIRARAILVLKERTGETFGYKADDRLGDRAAAVARWRAWHARTGAGAGG